MTRSGWESVLHSVSAVSSRQSSLVVTEAFLFEDGDVPSTLRAHNSAIDASLFRTWPACSRQAGKRMFFHRASLRGHDKPFIVPLIELWTYARYTHHRVFVTARPVTRVTLTNTRKNYPFASSSFHYASYNGTLGVFYSSFIHCLCPIWDGRM